MCTQILDNEVAAIAFLVVVRVIANAEAQVKPDCMRAPLQHIAQKISNAMAELSEAS